MADLRHDRAQILLIGALAMAVAFVALALILNSSVYVENLANRENVVVGSEGPTVYGDGVRRGVGRAVRAGNANGSSFADRQDDVERGVSTLGDAVGAYHAERGGVVDVTVVGHDQGTRVVRHGDGAFTEPNASEPNWELGSTRRFRRFGMTVTRSNLSTGLLGDVFRIEVEDDDGDVWKVYVYKATLPSRTVVETEPPSGPNSATCEDSSGSTTEINVTAAQVAGEHCEALDFFEAADPPYTVRYHNGGSMNVTGRYEFVMEGTDPSPNPDYAGDGEITTKPVVYDTTVEVVYYSADARYVTEFRVAPGEPYA